MSRHAFENQDSVLLEGGSQFQGCFRIGQGSTLRIGTFGEGRAVINSGETEAIWVENRSVLIENIEAIGAWVDSGQSGSQSYGIRVGCHLPGDEKIAGVTLRNVVARGYQKGGICIEGGGPDESRSGFDGVLIEDCVAHENGSFGIAMHGHWLNKREGWCHRNVIVRSCIAHHNRGLANQSSHTGSGIVISDLQGGLIERCLAYENGERNDFPGGGPVGIWCWDCNSVTIRDCESHHNRSQTKDGGGFDLDGGCTDCILEHNLSHDNAGAGVLLCQYNTARPFHHNIVRHHKSVNDGRHNGGGLVVYDDFDGISDCQVYGCHFRTSPSPGGQEVPATLRILTPTSGLEVFDNHFECTGDVPVAEIVEGQVGLILRDNKFVNPDAIQVRWQGEVLTDIESILGFIGLKNRVTTDSVASGAV